jgi:hypothetical protein
MIIMSQDRKSIYNFERISEIVVSGTEICISDNLRQEEGLVIATYKTEERAKEVSREILIAYANYNIFEMQEE